MNFYYILDYFSVHKSFHYLFTHEPYISVRCTKYSTKKVHYFPNYFFPALSNLQIPKGIEIYRSGIIIFSINESMNAIVESNDA